MKTLETLVKRVKADIDALSIEVGRAVSARNDILAEKAGCTASTEVESTQFDGSPLSALGLAPYLERQKARQAELDEALSYAERAHEECTKALSEAYAGLKKLEYLLAQQKLKAAKAAEQAEQAGFDERSSQMHARKSSLR